MLAERSSLVRYRVLFSPPHHQVLKDHLLELLAYAAARKIETPQDVARLATRTQSRAPRQRLSRDSSKLEG